MRLIIAPHPDDEVIGCLSVLLSARLHAQETLAIFYPCGLSDSGPHAVKKKFGVAITDKLPDLEKSDTIYAPDPYFEFHPEHRRWGHFAESLYRDRKVGSLLFYSINMSAPYIFEVPAPKMKRSILDECYSHKRDMWLYEHKYFLFEGLCAWTEPYSFMRKGNGTCG